MRNAAVTLASKANFRLNTRKLYASDAQCVSELHTIAKVVYEASRTDELDQPEVASIQIDMQAVESCRLMSKRLFEVGTEINDLLSLELRIRNLRTNAVSNSFDLDAVKRMLGESIQQTVETTENLKLHTREQENDKVHLKEKVQKREKEVERLRKRLHSLQRVRPAHQDEHDAQQNMLIKQYAEYVEKFRTLSYLESQLQQFKLREQSKLKESQAFFKDTQLQMQENAKRLLRNESELGQAEAISILNGIRTESGEESQANLASFKLSGSAIGEADDDDNVEVIDFSDEEENLMGGYQSVEKLQPRRKSGLQSSNSGSVQSVSADNRPPGTLSGSSSEFHASSNAGFRASELTGDSDEEF